MASFPVSIFVDRIEELHGTPAIAILIGCALLLVMVVVSPLVLRHRRRLQRVVLAAAIGLLLVFGLRSAFHSEVLFAQSGDHALCMTLSAGVVGIGLDRRPPDPPGTTTLRRLTRRHDGPQFVAFRAGTFPSVWRMSGRIDHYVEASLPLLAALGLASWRIRHLVRGRARSTAAPDDPTHA